MIELNTLKKMMKEVRENKTFLIQCLKQSV